MPRLLSFLKAHKGEAITLGALFCLVLGGTLTYALWPKEKATYADVILEGKLVTQLTLEKDIEYPVNTKQGKVVVEVYKNAVCVHSSPCPNQSCVHQGWKTKAGESIVCAHCALVVTLIGGEVSEVIV